MGLRPRGVFVQEGRVDLLPQELLSSPQTCIYLTSGVFRGGVDYATSPWSVHEVFDNFCIVFVSLVSGLNSKIRVPRLLVTVCIFCWLKTASKCTQTYHLGDKNYFSRERAQPLPLPHPVDAYGASPLLTDILNMPVYLTLHFLSVFVLSCFPFRVSTYVRNVFN